MLFPFASVKHLDCVITRKALFTVRASVRRRANALPILKLGLGEWVASVVFEFSRVFSYEAIRELLVT